MGVGTPPEGGHPDLRLPPPTAGPIPRKASPNKKLGGTRGGILMLRVWVPDLRPKGIMKARKQNISTLA